MIDSTYLTHGYTLPHVILLLALAVSLQGQTPLVLHGYLGLHSFHEKAIGLLMTI